MDERGRRGTASGRAGAGGARGRYPDRKPRRPESSGQGQNRRPARRSSRARRRRRNAAIRWTIFIVLIIAAAGGFVFWKKYGPSNERADLTKYYELEADNDVAVVINDQVIRRDMPAAEDGAAEAPAPGKMIDGQYYIEYSSLFCSVISVYSLLPTSTETLPPGRVYSRTLSFGSQ